ncbi:hypothetical protein [Aquimarina sediminis]|uniref:hypothetical protein n=1 Tax=Aquimarina sediminis TaxID=2070536 RepID=UPI0013E8C231|nr:hypothetical protein [Aquimarina sediminis]
MKQDLQNERFDIPLYKQQYQKTYPKGTGKSFIHFEDVITFGIIFPTTSFSQGPSVGQYTNQGLINQQPVPFINKQQALKFVPSLINFEQPFGVSINNALLLPKRINMLAHKKIGFY